MTNQAQNISARIQNIAAFVATAEEANTAAEGAFFQAVTAMGSFMLTIDIGKKKSIGATPDGKAIKSALRDTGMSQAYADTWVSSVYRVIKDGHVDFSDTEKATEQLESRGITGIRALKAFNTAQTKLESKGKEKPKQKAAGTEPEAPMTTAESVEVALQDATQADLLNAAMQIVEHLGAPELRKLDKAVQAALTVVSKKAA